MKKQSSDHGSSSQVYFNYTLLFFLAPKFKQKGNSLNLPNEYAVSPRLKDVTRKAP